MKPSHLAAALTLALASICPSQEAKPQSPQGVRLTYDLPVDAIQRTMQQRPGSTMEQLLTEAVKSIQQRLRRTGKVSRSGAASFVVDLKKTAPADIAKIKRVIEMIGSLEFRMVARDDYEEAELDLAEERASITKWLDDGGRERLRRDPAAIAGYKPLDQKKVRWVVRRIPRQQNRWQYSLTSIPQTKPATVAVFTKEEWNNGRVPPGTKKDAFLLEIIAVNMHERGFTELDLDPTQTRVTTDHADNPAILYRIRGEHAAMYADWSAKHKRQASAVIVNGELISAPIFLSKIVGHGMITGSFEKEQAEALAAALRTGALPAKPVLKIQEER